MLPSALRAMARSAAGSNSTLLGGRDRGETLLDLRERQAPQVELQAARQHRHRSFCGSVVASRKLDVRRRLLERLQQRVGKSAPKACAPRR